MSFCITKLKRVAPFVKSDQFRKKCAKISCDREDIRSRKRLANILTFLVGYLKLLNNVQSPLCCLHSRESPLRIIDPSRKTYSSVMQIKGQIPCLEGVIWSYSVNRRPYVLQTLFLSLK